MIAPVATASTTPFIARSQSVNAQVILRDNAVTSLFISAVERPQEVISLPHNYTATILKLDQNQQELLQRSIQEKSPQGTSNQASPYIVDIENDTSPSFGNGSNEDNFRQPANQFNNTSNLVLLQAVSSNFGIEGQALRDQATIAYIQASRVS